MAQDAEGDLKEQSQFVPGLTRATLSNKKDYDDESRPDSRENKAKQSQTKRAQSQAGAMQQVLRLSGRRLADQPEKN